MPRRTIILISALALVAAATGRAAVVEASSETLIPYEVLNRKEGQSWDQHLWLHIEVPLVDERLPSKQEMNAIAEHLVGTPRHARNWVFFLLPGMEVGAGAYATAHYVIDDASGVVRPEGVTLVPYALLNTDYAYLDPASRGGQVRLNMSQTAPRCPHLA